jgi:ribosome biogenesis protein Nip4
MEPAVASDRAQDLEEQRPGEILRRNRGPAGLGVGPAELRTQDLERLVNYGIRDVATFVTLR